MVQKETKVKKIIKKKQNKKPTAEKTVSRKRKIDVRMVIVSAILLVAVIVVAIVLVIYGRGELDESYFVTDSNKVVLSLNKQYVLPLEGRTGFVANKVYTVYYITGNKISSIKAFYQYDNNEDAKAVYGDTVLSCNDTEENSDIICNSWASAKGINGRYVIMQYDDNYVDGITVEQVRAAAGSEDEPSADTSDAGGVEDNSSADNQ